MKAVPKKRDQKNTKAKLLKAALDIFSKDGYDAATTRAIAKKAGVNESLIHRYFQSKLGLFLALRQQWREEAIAEFLVKYPAHDHLKDELASFLKYKTESSKRNKKFFKLSVSRAILDPKVRDTVQNYAKMKPQALVDRFESLRRKGEVRNDLDVDQALNVLHILSFGICLLSEALECISAEEVDDVIKSAVDILTRGIAPKK